MQKRKPIEQSMSIIHLGSMKLYATVTSERESRLVKKGGDEFIRIELSVKNKIIGQIELRANDTYAVINWFSRATNIEETVVNIPLK